MVEDSLQTNLPLNISNLNTNCHCPILELRQKTRQIQTYAEFEVVTPSLNGDVPLPNKQLTREADNRRGKYDS